MDSIYYVLIIVLNQIQIFDKSVIFSALVQFNYIFLFIIIFFLIKLTHIQLLIKNECMEARIISCFFFKAEVCFFLFTYCMFRYSYKKYSGGHATFVKMIKNGWQLLK